LFLILCLLLLLLFVFRHHAAAGNYEKSMIRTGDRSNVLNAGSSSSFSTACLEVHIE